MNEQVEKLGSAREFATKEANRYLVLSVVFSLIYLAKTRGIGLEQLVIGEKISKVHIGAFVYLVISQFCSSLSQMRFIDAGSLEKNMAVALSTPYGPKGRLNEIFPNPREWGSVTLHLINKSDPSHRLGYWLAAAPSLLLALVAFCLPALTGLIFVGNPFSLRFSLAPDPILTLVVISTFLNISWLISGAIHVVMLGRE